MKETEYCVLFLKKYFEKIYDAMIRWNSFVDFNIRISIESWICSIENDERTKPGVFF